MTHTIFEHLPAGEPPANFLDHIMARIHTARAKQLRLRLMLAFATTIFAGFFAFLDRAAILTEWQTTPFFSLVRLFGTDADIFFTNANDAMEGLLETLPLDAILATLIFACASLSVIIAWNAWRRERHFISHPTAL